MNKALWEMELKPMEEPTNEVEVSALGIITS